MLPWLRGGVESPPPALPPSRLLSLRSCSSFQRPPALAAAVSPVPPRRYLPATMAHRGTPSAPKRPGLTAPDRSFQVLLPPCWPRSWPLLLLLLVLVAACGAMGRSPQPGRWGPSVQVTRLLPAGRTESSNRQDPQTRESEPGVPGLRPGSASGPSTDGAPALGKGRRVRAAPVAGAASASRAQVSLISTSFVLKGDATHNQAMVHWTGENSSVSDLRTPPALPGHLGIPRETTTAPLLPDHPRSLLLGILGYLGDAGHLGGAPTGFWLWVTFGRVLEFVRFGFAQKAFPKIWRPQASLASRYGQWGRSLESSGSGQHGTTPGP